jgi:hypothetical protein
MESPCPWRHHGVNINGSTAIQKSKLLVELQDLHSRRDSFHHSGLPFLLAQSDAKIQKLKDFVDTNYVSTIRTWLRMWKPTFEDGTRRASVQAMHGTGRIFDPFPVVHQVLRNRDPIHRGLYSAVKAPTTAGCSTGVVLGGVVEDTSSPERNPAKASDLVVRLMGRWKSDAMIQCLHPYTLNFGPLRPYAYRRRIRDPSASTTPG